MSADILLVIIVTFAIANFVFDKVLAILNTKTAKKAVPAEISDFYDEEKYQKSIEYKKVNDRFSFLTSSISFIISLSLLLTGAFGWFDTLLREYISNPILLALAYFGVLFIISDILTIPFQWYRTFVIEERFGFNTMTGRLFLFDKLKGYLLTIIIGGLIGAALFWLILSIGQSFWIYFLIIIVAIMLFTQLFYASLILPLFNKLSPLEDGELLSAINAYALKENFPLSKVFVIDGSKRSKKANAFFMGLGNRKKIVLYDTLIENHSTEELVAVLAHEMGHYKKKHIISGLLLSVFQVALTMYVLSLLVFNENLSIALGAEQLSIHLNLIAFSILYSPISTITSILMNIWSRKNEFEADHFAKETYSGEKLALALKKLSSDSLSNLFPHPAYVFVHYSHPPLLKRLQALREN